MFFDFQYAKKPSQVDILREIEHAEDVPSTSAKPVEIPAVMISGQGSVCIKPVIRSMVTEKWEKLSEKARDLCNSTVPNSKNNVLFDERYIPRELFEFVKRAIYASLCPESHKHEKESFRCLVYMFDLRMHDHSVGKAERLVMDALNICEYLKVPEAENDILRQL